MDLGMQASGERLAACRTGGEKGPEGGAQPTLTCEVLAAADCSFMTSVGRSRD